LYPYLILYLFSISGFHEGVQLPEGAHHSPLGYAGASARAADPATPP